MQLKYEFTRTKPRKLILPEKNENNNRVITYLTGRSIHITLIDYCIQTGRLAANTVKALLSPLHTISDEPPKRGKDYNDYLKITLKIQQTRERE